MPIALRNVLAAVFTLTAVACAEPYAESDPGGNRPTDEETGGDEPEGDVFAEYEESTRALLLATCECTSDGEQDCSEFLGQVMPAIRCGTEVYRAYGDEIAAAVACTSDALAEQAACIEAASECSVSTPAECSVTSDCPQPPALADAVADALEACG